MEKALSDQHSEDDTTRATARLPGLDIEIVHRRAGGAERISVHLQATPSFEAFGRQFETANPFALWAEAWTEAAQLMWLPVLPLFGPWLGAARALLPPRKVEEAPPTSPEQ